MKQQRFKALDIEIPIEDRFFFYDNDLVRDMKKHVKYLTDEYHKRFSDYWYNDSTRGLCCSFDSNGQKHVHIFYKNNNPIVRAHEEAHAIEFLEQEKLLCGIIAQELNLAPSADLYDWGNEAFASRVSLFPLLKKGLTPKQCLQEARKQKIILVVPHMEEYFLEPLTTQNK